ncbi:serinc-domain containing serine and sphingolipid biosynthesis protein [Actinidia rufa]|uniref:Serinc-domain containing serine and sphingolipid biosynthesis protein n=1 Tax=Actinidia rufa TaxID=165716 RepID=A0A7J0E4X8_9ERIC|nr:serinc-domain containing serine and sphingolipid biosynthesis protein [Actinidia rufa]
MGEAASTIEVKVVGTKRKTSDVGPWEEFTGILEQKRVECSEQRKKSLRARYLYGILFLLANLVAWCVRDYGQMVSPQLHYLKACGVEGQDCFHTMGVLRASLLVLGAGVFLLLQLISIIEFITWWNNYWMPDERRKQSCSLGLFTSTVFYIASVCGIGVMYSLYAPRPSCILNIFFITWTAILLVVMMVISLHSKVNRGLLSSGIMASYIVFLCWSAIRSEPATEKCSPKEHETGHGDWTTVLFRKDDVQQDDDIPYKYGFFHLIFSLGAMYFAMLFISWNLDSSTRKWSIDVGWASTWVKIVNEWFAATIYLWKLMYPVVRQSKIMDHKEPVQESDNNI